MSSFKKINPILCLIAGIGISGLGSWIYGRKIIFLYRIVNNLRNLNSNAIANSNLKEKDYVLVEGEVTCRKNADGDMILAPKSKQKCVFYRSIKFHVYEKEDKVIENKAASTKVSKIPHLRNTEFTLGRSKIDANRQMASEIVTDIYQQMNLNSWFIKSIYSDGTDSTNDSQNNLFVIDLKQYFETTIQNYSFMKVVNLEDFLVMNKTHEEFTETTKKNVSVDKVHSTLGYKTIEYVLKENDHILILGEIVTPRSIIIEGEKATAWKIQEAESNGILDLKTARVKPLIISCLDKNSLKKKLEKSILLSAAKCAAINVIGVGLGFLGFMFGNTFFSNSLV